MNIIEKMLKRCKSPFPKKVKEHWYCGSWYLYLSKLREKGIYKGTSLEYESPAIDEVAFNPFHMGLWPGADKTGLINGLIPAIQVGDRIGLYKQVGGRNRDQTFYDGASWDDGYHIDLKFVKSIKKEIA